MICVVALIVFGVLGIFSARHRELAREAFACVFRRVTLRNCETGFDRRVKQMAFNAVANRNEAAGYWVMRHAEALSWVFTLLVAGSLLFSAVGAYNWAVYGNCNGENSSELCLLNPETYAGNNPLAWLFPPSPSDVKSVSREGLPLRGNPDAKVQIIEVGCFTCPYTKATEPLVVEVMERFEGDVALYFKYFPLPRHAYSFEAAVAAECAREQGKFWEYKAVLFERQLECVEQPDEASLLALYKRFAADLGLDNARFNACLDGGKYAAFVEQQKRESMEAGIYGTPTFFINGRVLVAPQSLDEFSEVIEEELAKKAA